MLNWLFRTPDAPRLPSAAPAQASQTRVMQLERRVDSLQLACVGLWNLLKTKHGYADDDLIEFIRSADAADGTLDGKVTTANLVCSRCKRKVLTSNREKCSWCGSDLAGASF